MISHDILMAVLPRRAKWLTAAPIFLQALVGSIQHHKQLIIKLNRMKNVLILGQKINLSIS